jgi:hypothetical protein
MDPILEYVKYKYSYKLYTTLLNVTILGRVIFLDYRTVCVFHLTHAPVYVDVLLNDDNCGTSRDALEVKIKIA